MRIDINLLLTIIGIIIALLIGLKSNKNSSAELQNQEHDTIKHAAYNDGRVDAKLDNISTTVARTDTNVENLKTDIRNIDKRLVKVEESTKSAHHRLDQICAEKEKTK